MWASKWHWTALWCWFTLVLWKSKKVETTISFQYAIIPNQISLEMAHVCRNSVLRFFENTIFSNNRRPFVQLAFSSSGMEILNEATRLRNTWNLYHGSWNYNVYGDFHIYNKQKQWMLLSWHVCKIMSVVIRQSYHFPCLASQNKLSFAKPQ